MGFRLSVRCANDKDLSFYGTKLFGYVLGYVHDETKLESWKYLKELGKLDEISMGDEYAWWDGYVGDIELSEKEFNLFIGYYTKDLIDKYSDIYIGEFMKDIYPVLKEPGGKIVSWV